MKDLRPGQLLKFHERLMQKAQEHYTPHYFAVQKKSKAPGVNGSWKTQHARLTIAQAKKRLAENYGNVGIAGKPGDQLLLLDIDDPSILDEVKDTLKVRSRSRGTEENPAIHAIYLADPEDDKLPANITTNKGELRSRWEYVVAPGSYVPCTEEELQEKVEQGEINEEAKHEILNDKHRGYYTIHKDKEIQQLSFNELPEIFKEEYNSRRSKNTVEIDSTVSKEDIPENASKLFHLNITDLTQEGLTGRDPHPLHNSETGSNWCIDREDEESEKLGHCWRHLVSLNAIQFLCVESGYLNCEEAGTPHTHGDVDDEDMPVSRIKDDDEAIWKAWKHAKAQGYIPEDDPVPVRAMKHIARKENIYDAEDGEMLPTKAYNKVLTVMEDDY